MVEISGDGVFFTLGWMQEVVFRLQLRRSRMMAVLLVDCPRESHMACLRDTYAVVVTFLGLCLLIILGGRLINDDFPASGYVLIGIWSIPGLYWFLEWRRANLGPSVRSQENYERWSQKTWARRVFLPLVLAVMVEIGPLYLIRRERDGWFKNPWLRLWLHPCLLLFLIFAVAMACLDPSHPRYERWLWSVLTRRHNS
jgi:hypothetical protein